MMDMRMTKSNMTSWLKQNTFRHTKFSDIGRMVEEKQKKGITISCCIPSLNEEKTIGKEIVLLKAELMTRFPLLDELAVIDSGSTDRTLEVAAEYGADTYLSADILPDSGFKKGKGENLWKAIYQLKGDIILYIDADIKNIHPRFAYGLLAPLIFNDNTMYSKAFYERPLVVGGGSRPAGGGRVTEILIRPLFSLFFPELSGIMQPLSGEYAARREVLEKLPFPIGYGVETAHLIDIYTRWGLDAIAQVDLDQRVHRNQDTRSLARMSFGILQTFLLRMRQLGLIEKLPDMSDTLRQFECADDVYSALEFRIVEEERPPMIEIPEYRKKFGRQ